MIDDPHNDQPDSFSDPEPSPGPIEPSHVTKARTRTLTRTAPNRIHVSRAYSTPDVTRMISDAYHVIDQQLGRFRAESSFNKFEVKDATTLHKLVCTLKILEDAEKARIGELKLSSLNGDSLELLAGQAALFMDSDDKP